MDCQAKCEINLVGFQRFDKGTQSTIFDRLKYFIFVIVQSILESQFMLKDNEFHEYFLEKFDLN